MSHWRVQYMYNVLRQEQASCCAKKDKSSAINIKNNCRRNRSRLFFQLEKEKCGSTSWLCFLVHLSLLHESPNAATRHFFKTGGSGIIMLLFLSCGSSSAMFTELLRWRTLVTNVSFGEGIYMIKCEWFNQALLTKKAKFYFEIINCVFLNWY